MNMTRDDITAIILAGGKGRRMGGLDKGLIEYQGRLLVAHVIERLQPQVGPMLINANRNPEEYQRYGFPVIADSLPDYQGPLAGFIAGLQAANTDVVLVVPCDGPHLPHDLVSRMTKALQRENADISVAHDGKRLQPVYALMSRGVLPSLQACIQSGHRRVDAWYASEKTALADFSDTPESFFNINYPEDNNDKRA
jgi:molybdenum cofactor guanylyltransferase